MIARIIESTLADAGVKTSRNSTTSGHLRLLRISQSAWQSLGSHQQLCMFACKPARTNHRLDHVTRNALRQKPKSKA